MTESWGRGNGSWVGKGACNAALQEESGSCGDACRSRWPGWSFPKCVAERRWGRGAVSMLLTTAQWRFEVLGRTSLLRKGRRARLLQMREPRPASCVGVRELCFLRLFFAGCGGLVDGLGGDRNDVALCRPVAEVAGEDDPAQVARDAGLGLQEVGVVS